MIIKEDLRIKLDFMFRTMLVIENHGIKAGMDADALSDMISTFCMGASITLHYTRNGTSAIVVSENEYFNAHGIGEIIITDMMNLKATIDKGIKFLVDPANRIEQERLTKEGIDNLTTELHELYHGKVKIIREVSNG